MIIEKYCMFIGFSRSGHSLIGALLDAHPEIIISHELNVLEKINNNEISDFLSLESSILKKSINFYKKGSTWRGYTYGNLRVPNQYQGGKYTTLKVIGDKKGSGTSLLLRENCHLLDELKYYLQEIDVKYIFVKRNPYDMMATVKRKKPNKDINILIEGFFNQADGTSIYKKTIPVEDWFEFKHEDFIDNPDFYLRELCKFLDVTIDEEWVKDCSSIVWKKPHESRHKMKWKGKKEELTRRLKEYEFFEDYLE